MKQARADTLTDSFIEAWYARLEGAGEPEPSPAPGPAPVDLSSLPDAPDYQWAYYRAIRSTALWLAGLRGEDHAENMAGAWDNFVLAAAVWNRFVNTPPFVHLDADPGCVCLGCLWGKLESL